MPHVRSIQTHSITRRRFVGVTGTATAALLLAGCGDDEESASSGSDQIVGHRIAASDYEPMFAAYEPAEEPDGDPSKVVWPDFVLASSPDIQELYAFHVTSGGLMRYMPCFCGCTGSGHRNNRDCYIKEVHADGSITFDSMAPT